jgi:hypothetical protein
MDKDTTDLRQEWRLAESESITVLDQPMPLHSGDAMVAALDAYTELQAKLDARLPEAIVSVGDKKFRTKLYWRTISRAFGLSVGEVSGSEQRLDGENSDWGYKVTYRATSPSGSYTDGDGACMAAEKYGNSGTEHNVRSHAHTRAFNRAVSNLCGFGEVSHEELVDTAVAATTPVRQAPAAPAPPPTAARDVLDDTEPQSFVTYVGREGATDDAPACDVNEGVGRNGKPYKLYIVNFQNGLSASTFDVDMYQFAESCHSRGVSVAATLTPRPKKAGDKFQSYNLTDLSEMSEAPKPIEDDPIPF